MHHIVNVYSNQAGFVTPPGDAPPIPKYPPILSVPDPLRPRLRTDKIAEAEARNEQQRTLIDEYKSKNPGVSADKMFEVLTRRHPEVFHDNEDDGDDDEDNMPSDEKRRLDAKREVISDFQSAHPSMSIDRVYATLTRLNPAFFED
jgi:hypothetical protein